MSLRVTPGASHPTSTAKYPSAPSAPGLPDRLRASATPAAQTNDNGPAQQPLSSSHPLEARLANWQATQESIKMEGLRRTFGIAEPIRRGMELRMARQGEWRPAALGGNTKGVHTELLEGRESDITWEDVFVGGEFGEGVDFHSEMEARLRMNTW
ncbi:proteasome maturation factor UMP1 [Xylona heveae TC161]|uniref:Proteasome maturation factor UMP1 n=1 Tax=Xylona heveae (strain CBS 132557 / TC161) TaxID=1328760 RepID=A0A161TBZ5_XYLHT|nr:proteasome maturation factor UMP1 [Xylona heveae TC161]KZF23247.1 proteasome maturation factor UMP1 [Xylona heveae TC161]